MRRSVSLALIVLVPSFSAHAQPIDVAVHKVGQLVIVDVSARVPVEPEHAWNALTDFDHMADYLSAIKSSRVVSRKGSSLEVAQEGEARRGLLHFSFSTVRAVELIPKREVVSHLISGSGFKSYEFVTRIVPAGQGATTIAHHGEYVPTAWVPPVVGPALIEAETRKQYAELIAEMLRRQAAASQKR